MPLDCGRASAWSLSTTRRDRSRRRRRRCAVARPTTPLSRRGWSRVDFQQTRLSAPHAVPHTPSYLRPPFLFLRRPTYCTAMFRNLAKQALQRTGLFPAARATYRALNGSIRAERAKEITFYSALLPPNSLCFDVGANLGQKAEVFLACGARVIIVEPNVLCHPTLEFHFNKNPNAQIVPQAVGATAGILDLHIHGTDSTASVYEDWDRTVFGPGRKTTTVTVAVTTLDALIQRFGAPDFIKIDVEGAELDVLRGLSQFVPLLSFEYHCNNIDRLRQCLSETTKLGKIAIRASDMNCNWITAETENINACLSHIKASNANGDMFIWLADC